MATLQEKKEALLYISGGRVPNEQERVACDALREAIAREEAGPQIEPRTVDVTLRLRVVIECEKPSGG